MNAVTCCGITWSREYYYFDEKEQLQIKTLNLFERILRSFGWYEETQRTVVLQKAHALAFHDKLPADAMPKIFALMTKVNDAYEKRVSKIEGLCFLGYDREGNPQKKMDSVTFQAACHRLVFSRNATGQMVIDGLESTFDLGEVSSELRSRQVALVLVAKIVCDSDLPSIDCIVEMRHRLMDSTKDPYESLSCKTICKVFERCIGDFGWKKVEDLGTRSLENSPLHLYEASQGRESEMHKVRYQLTRELAEDVVKKLGDTYFNEGDKVCIKAFLPA